MDRIRIIGGQRLNGTIPISGAKNATLPLMIASLLTEDTLILENVPRLADVILLQRILGNHGVDVMIAGKRPGDDPNSGRTIHISAKHIVDTTAPYDLVSKMRASFWVVAPLLARMGEAKVSMPGGCAIGTRPVDLLIMALEKLGAEIEIEGGYVIARAKKGLRGGEINFPKVTVGGTHTAMMAAAMAQGTTVIENAAREPEIGDVADCLNKMGARISGAGTARIVVEGVAKLHGARHAVLPDRIETGTYAMAVAMTGGDVLLQNARPELLQSALDVLAQLMGGGSNSYLYRALVIDRPLAVSASAGYQGTSLDPTQFMISVAPRPGVEFAAVEQVVDSVIADVGQNAVHAEDLERVKTQLIAEAIYAQDNQATLARWYGAALTTGLSIEDIRSWPDRIRAVTSEQVRAVAQKWLDKKRSVTGYLIKDTTPKREEKRS